MSIESIVESQSDIAPNAHTVQADANIDQGLFIYFDVCTDQIIGYVTRLVPMRVVPLHLLCFSLLQ